MKEEITIEGQKYILKSSIKQKEKIVVPKGDKSNPFLEVGKVYFIRTVTHYFTGLLEWVGEKEIAISSACWISDTGRFNEFLKDKGKVNESEPFPEGSIVIVGRGSIIDMTEYKPSLILSVK
jgi:hypothetical protein